MSKKLPTIGIIGVVLLAAIGLYVFVGQLFGTISNLQQALDTRPEVTVTSNRPTLTHVKSLGELSTISRQYATAKIEVNLRYGVGCGITTKHTAQTTIKAGVDFNSIGEGDIVYDEESKTYTVTLPAPRLMECIFDPFASEQYTQSGSHLACPVDPDEMRHLSTYEALTKFTNTAIETGILDDAKLEAETVLGNFIQALTQENVVIRFKPAPRDPIIPPSCQPALSADWVFDENIKAWKKQ